MVNYESLLLGGKQKKSTGGKMSYEERCKNLEKARATRAANLKKKVKGEGNYTQDYVNESQINYAGSPLDMYYVNTPEQKKKLREKRGEVGAGMDTVESAMDTLTGGKMHRKKKSKKDEELLSEALEGGKMKRGKGTDSMDYMKNSLHTGLDMPTEQQFKKGGKISKVAKKAYEHKAGEYKVDLEGAIENLANLASKFGLRLVN